MRPHTTLALAAALSACGSLACFSHLGGQNKAPVLVRKQAPSPRSKTAIQNVHVFNGQTFSSPRTVIIDGSVIGMENDTSNIQTTVDGSNKYLIPGLIDSHVHIGDVQGLETMTSYGVTTAVVMNCQNYTTCNYLRTQDGLCSFVGAGIAAVAPTGSHTKIFNVPGSELVYPTSNPSEVVGQAFGNSSDFYKIVAEAGGVSQDLMNELVVSTHALGRQTMTHAAGVEYWGMAVASQTDGIQHTAPDGALHMSVITQAMQNGQFNTPTMNIFAYQFNDPSVAAFLDGNHGISTNSSYTTVRQNVAAAYKAGLPILAGTDAVGELNAGSNSLDIPWGITLHYELQNLVDAGLSPAEALIAATISPAKYHRLSDRGAIAPGLRADLVLLNSNPLDNITNTMDVAKVWAAGAEYANVTPKNASATNPAFSGSTATSTSADTSGVGSTGTGSSTSAPISGASSFSSSGGTVGSLLTIILNMYLLLL